jgi:membrane protein YdbS with pleckstrin-like domain
MNCPVCNQETIDEASFCHHCGAQLGESPPEPTPRQKFQAAAGDNPDDDPPERELWQGSYSKLGMIGSWVGAAVFSVAMLLLAALASFSGRAWLISLALIGLVWICIVLRLLYLQLSRHYYLTNQKFTHERGLLWREIDRIEAIDIDDVSFSQGPVERMLGVGSIRIMSSDLSHPKMDLPGIENVRVVASMIDEVRRQERRKRGLYVESV